MCFKGIKRIETLIQYPGLPDLDDIYEDLPLLPEWMFQDLTFWV